MVSPPRNFTLRAQHTSGLTPPMLTPSLTGSAPLPVPFSSPSNKENLQQACTESERSRRICRDTGAKKQGRGGRAGEETDAEVGCTRPAGAGAHTKTIIRQRNGQGGSKRTTGERSSALNVEDRMPESAGSQSAENSRHATQTRADREAAGRIQGREDAHGFSPASASLAPEIARSPGKKSQF